MIALALAIAVLALLTAMSVSDGQAQEPTLKWPVANCFPPEQIEERLQVYSIEGYFDATETLARIREACSRIRAEDRPDPATSHIGTVNDAQFLPDGSMISVGADRTLRLWDSATENTPPRLLHTGQGELWQVRPSPDGRFAAVSSYSEPVRILHLQSGKVVATLETASEGARAMAYLPDGRSLLAAAAANEVGLFDAASGKLIRKYPPFGKYALLSSIAVTANGEVAAAITGGSEIRVWLVETGQTAMEGQRETGGTALAFEPGGTRLVMGMVELFEIYNLQSGKFEQPLKLSLPRRWRGVGAVFLPERNRLLTCGATANVWDLASARDLGELLKFPFQCYSLALSPDGSKALVTHEDSDIRLIDVATGAVTATLGKAKLPDLAIPLPLKK